MSSGYDKEMQKSLKIAFMIGPKQPKRVKLA